MVKTPCTCRSPTPVTCTVSQRLGVFQTVTTMKTICKSYLGQLLATEFDIDVKPCFSFSTCARLHLTPSAACLKRCVVSNKTHEKTHLCVDRACACLSVFVPVKTPTSTAADNQEKCMRKCASCAVHSKLQITPGHIGDPSAKNVSSWHVQARGERTLKV